MSQWYATRGHFLTREEAVEVSGIPGPQLVSRDDVLRLGGSHAIEEVYPAFQFETGSPVPAMATVLVALQSKLGSWGSAAWLTTPRNELAGFTPYDWMRVGNPQSAVLALIAA